MKFCFTFSLLFLTSLFCWSQEVKLRIPKGGLYNTKTAIFSPDGKYILTAQMDNTFNEWEIKSGKFVGGLNFNNSEPNAWVNVKYSPATKLDSLGGRYYAALGDRVVVSVFDRLKDTIFDFSHETGEYLNRIYAFDFSPTSNHIVTCGSDKKAIVWDLSTGKKKFELAGHKSIVNTVLFSPDGKYIATTSFDGFLRLWDSESGKLFKSIKSNKEGCWLIEFSSNSKYLLSGTDKNKLQVWDIQSLSLITLFDSHSSEWNNADFDSTGTKVVSCSRTELFLWDALSGSIEKRFEGHKENINWCEFSPDNQLIVSSSDDNSAKIWDVKKGMLLQSLEHHKYGVFSAQFSPKNKNDNNGGKQIVTSSADGTAVLWNVQLGTILVEFKGKIDPLWDAKFNSNYSKIIYYSRGDQHNSGLYSLDMSSGKNKLIYNDTLENYKNLFVSDSASELIYFQGQDNLIEINLESENQNEILRHNSSNFSNKSILIPEKNQFISINDTTLKIIDLTSKKVLFEHSFPSSKYYCFDIIGEKIAICLDSYVTVFDIKSGRVINKIKHSKKSPIIELLKFVSENELLLINQYGTISKYNLEIKSETAKLEGHYSNIYSIVLSKDKTKLLTGSVDHLAILWDLKLNQEIKRFELVQDVSSAFFTSDEKGIVTVSYDGSINLFDIPTGKSILKQYLIKSDPSKWVHIHASGLFDASPEAMDLLYWTKGYEIIDFVQLKDRYWEPGLWEKVMKGDELRSVRDMQELKLQPELTLGEYDEKTGKIPVTLTKRDGGYGKVTLLINGKEIEADARGEEFDASKEKQTIYVNIKDHPYLKDSLNSISVKASSEDGFVTGRPEEKVIYIKLKAPQKPHLYSICIGTGIYSNPKINLKYPEKDAQSISKALQIGAIDLFGSENTHIYTLTTSDSEKLTKHRIKQVFEEIAQKATSSDVLVLYLSGHGITWGGENGDFYYLTTEASSANSEAFNDPVIRNNYTISTAEFTEWIKIISANKQVMIIDACSSGKAIENLITAREIDASSIKAIDRMKDRTGMFVISGSAADAASYEASRYGQGLLTYSILQAMKGAKLREGKFFDADLILNYAREIVPELAKGIGGIQQPQLLIPKGGSFDFGKVDENSVKEIPLNSIKPVFVRTTFVESSEFSDLLNLSKKVDEQLSLASAKGDISNFVFFDSREFPDAYRLSGGYSEINGVLNLTLKIKGPKEEEFKLEASSVDELVDQIVQIAESQQ